MKVPPFSWFLNGAAKMPIYLYRYSLALFLGGRCRHAPSCSEYGVSAIDRNGVWRGFWLTVSRILRCRPGGTSGFDPAPDIRGEYYPFWAAWRYGRWSARDLVQHEALETADEHKRVD